MKLTGRPCSNVELYMFGTCKVRRMNQLGTALLYMGRLYHSIPLSLSNKAAKDRLRFIRRTSHVPNLNLHKLW